MAGPGYPATREKGHESSVYGLVRYAGLPEPVGPGSSLPSALLTALLGIVPPLADPMHRQDVR